MTPDHFLVRKHNSPTLERAIADARHPLGWMLKASSRRQCARDPQRGLHLLQTT
jgi:hypothetical protein